MKVLRKSSIILLLAITVLGSFLSVKSFAVDEGSLPSSYNNAIGQQLVTRCDLIKDYMSQTVRINELAARQNKVRGWEYILRQLSENKSAYVKFNVSYTELEAKIKDLKQQLEQFKVDFEAYDSAFQKLLSVSCKDQPQEFWYQLEVLRSFRSGVSLAAENYKNSLGSVILNEEAKW